MLHSRGSELDLKKWPGHAKAKKVEMLPLGAAADHGLHPGRLFPIGMKKKFPTYIDETAQLFDEIAVSGGVRGEQVLLHRRRWHVYGSGVCRPCERLNNYINVTKQTPGASAAGGLFVIRNSRMLSKFQMNFRCRIGSFEKIA